MGFNKTTLVRELDAQPRSDIIVPNGGTTSNGFIVAQCSAGSFQTPAALSSSSVTFEVSGDGVTWVPLKKTDGSGNESITVAASGGYTLPFHLFLHSFARYVFGTAEGGQRTILTTLQN